MVSEASQVVPSTLFFKAVDTDNKTVCLQSQFIRRLITEDIPLALYYVALYLLYTSFIPI